MRLTFDHNAESQWRFFTDQVMGGVSTGQVSVIAEDGVTFARLTGQVSTENNGGFIQMRHDLPNGAPQGSAGVQLIVRGNGQRYFVHLRNADTRRPWQYHQAGFDVTQNWTEIRLPFDAFVAAGGARSGTLSARTLTSVAIVAFGRDHSAQIDVAEVGFYPPL